MLNLLRTEIYKFFRAKTFWALSGIITVLIFLAMFLFNLGEKGLLDEMDGLEITIEYESSGEMLPGGVEIFVESLTSPHVLIMMLIAAVIGTFYLTKEFSLGTIKNQISLGHSRISIYLAKWIVFSVSSVIVSVFIIPAASFVSASLFFGVGEWPEGTGIQTILSAAIILMIYMIAFVSVSMLFNLLTSSTGKALLYIFGFYFIASKGPALLAGRIKWVETLQNYSVFHRIYDLGKLPLNGAQTMEMILIPVVTAVLFIAAGLTVFQRKDIK